jgi:ERF superfamily.
MTEQNIALGIQPTEEITYSINSTSLPAFSPQEESILQIFDPDQTTFYGNVNQIKEMFTAWANFTGEVENPAKTALNPHLKANYAPLDEVLNSVKPILAKYGFGLIQVPTFVENQVKVHTIIVHSSGGYISFAQLAIPSAPGAQAIVSTSTYGRRSALNAICGIYGENDDDGETGGKGGKPKKDTPAPSPVDKELQELKGQILFECSKKKSEGINQDSLYDIIKKHNDGVKNPNTFKSVESAKKALEEIKSV